ncbi:hypothetical protein AB0B83_06725 [Micromonospora sp. NPDC049060]|uniref:hypothetical protein n=1 Tax=unclassified Micromonospora TaxID=2617518 RepID=UPI0033C3EB7C
MRIDSVRQRTLGAMVTMGILTALAPAGAAQAAPGVNGESSGADQNVLSIGVNTATGDRVVQAAYDELNSDHKFETPMGSNCNFYSNHWGKGCQAWCADFVKYVWKNAGVYAWEHLDSEAGTTARYGKFFGTWHPGTTSGIYPGAAVTYNSSGDPAVDSDHVGVYVGVVNGTQKVVSGNFSNQVYKHNLHYGGAPFAGWTGVG